MIIITATGYDRPGMVAAISQKLFEANCNIEDTTMTRLSGQFAMILVVAPPAELSTLGVEQLLTSLHESHGLHIHCNELQRHSNRSTPDDAPRYILSVYGADKTGLVARVAQALAQNDANITDLQTRIAASHTVYVMIYEFELPADRDLEELRADIEEAARELQVEYSLRTLDEDTL